MCDELLANNTVRDMLPVIAALAASLITGLLALAAARASMRATRSDRVWDARREGYTAILTRLKEASVRASVVDDGYNSGDYGQGPHHYFESPHVPTKRRPLATLGETVARLSTRVGSCCPTTFSLVRNGYSSLCQPGTTMIRHLKTRRDGRRRFATATATCSGLPEASSRLRNRDASRRFRCSLGRLVLDCSTPDRRLSNKDLRRCGSRRADQWTSAVAPPDADA